MSDATCKQLPFDAEFIQFCPIHHFDGRGSDESTRHCRAEECGRFYEVRRYMEAPRFWCVWLKREIDDDLAEGTAIEMLEGLRHVR